MVSGTAAAFLLSLLFDEDDDDDDDDDGIDDKEEDELLLPEGFAADGCGGLGGLLSDEVVLEDRNALGCSLLSPGAGLGLAGEELVLSGEPGDARIEAADPAAAGSP